MLGCSHAGDAGANQGLVADDLERQADQDRREGGEPRLLCRLPDGRGRHSTANVPGDSAAHRGIAAAATTSASMRRSTVMRSRATDGVSASECQGKRPDQAVKHRSDGREYREPSTLSDLGFQPVQKTTTIHVSSGFIWGIPDNFRWTRYEGYISERCCHRWSNPDRYYTWWKRHHAQGYRPRELGRLCSAGC